MDWLNANYELTAFDTVLVAGTAFVAGLMRGFSGFGAALTIAPVLAVAVGPRAAIPAILFLMLATSAQLAPRAIRDVNWPTVVPLSVGGVISPGITDRRLAIDRIGRPGTCSKIYLYHRHFLCDCDADGLAVPGRYRGLG